MVARDRKNPLVRSGTSQPERAPEALDPSYASVDERSLADLMVFAQRYGRHIQFYDAANQKDGDWLPLWSRDPSAVLAVLASLPFESFVRFSRSLRAWLGDDPARPPAVLGSHFRLLFHLPLVLLREVGRHYDRLPQGHPLRVFVYQNLQRDLKAPLRDVVAYYLGARTPHNDVDLFADTGIQVGDYNVDFADADPRIQLPTAVTRLISDPELNTGTSGSALMDLDIGDAVVAGLEPAGWGAFVRSTTADSGPYSATSGSVFGDVRDALNYGLLTKSIERIFQGVERIAREAASQIEASLSTEEHGPHYGLYLAFLQLFAHNQAHLNELTERHLDFYYEEVLQIQRRSAEPSHAHLLVELNKNQDAHLVEAGTRLKAGKDATGVPVVFATSSDLVANRAQVVELRSLHLMADAASGGVVRPFAASVTNSLDGHGEELSADTSSWPPFGPAVDHGDARIGFAIADRKLFLREGERKITVTFALHKVVVGGFSGGLRARLSSEEGWFEGAKLEVEGTLSGDLVVTLDLTGDDPAIVPYDSEVHGEEFAGPEPMLLLSFGFVDGEAAGADAEKAFAALRDATFDDVSLKVTANGLRNVSHFGDQGVLDGAKPFMPFGPMPRVGASWTLGSSEVFSKNLKELALNLEWSELYGSKSYFRLVAPSAYELTVRYLDAGRWSSTGESGVGLFEGDASFGSGLGQPAPAFAVSSSKMARSVTEILARSSTRITLDEVEILPALVEQENQNPTFSTTATTGFVRLELGEDFGHGRFTMEKTIALIKASGSGGYQPDKSAYNFDANDIPLEPYVPEVAEFSLDYETTTDAPARFIHLHPFGHRVASDDNDRAFPDLQNAGELYIGIADLDPPERLSLLVQTVDGTANPLSETADVAWAYLSGDEWVPFANQDVDDKTDDLTGSGIVGLAIPDGADTDHRLLPSGFHWVRMSVSERTDAVNDLLTISAQAVLATFVDEGNDPDFAATPLPAETISKLEVGDVAVKKVVQPYPAFGGRAAEADDAFRVRVSERLRHKDRASTVWDYERLVLEQFPSLYRVKCIQHTELVRDVAGDIVADNELRPGYVLVVAVPYVTSDGPVDPLRPYVDKKTLGEVGEFLSRRMSPFVNLEVQNPKIEEVQVSFEVAFHDEIEDMSFYRSVLNDAIVKYLTPWSYDESRAIGFGGRWHKSALIDFVEEQSYVDYVKDFEMYHKTDIDQPDGAWPRVDVEVAEATTARSVLVSHATHTILDVSPT